VTEKILNNSRGIAIIIAVTVIAILVTAALELNRRTSAVVEFTDVSRKIITLEHMTSSGINMAMALLLKDKKESEKVDSLQEDWADEEIISNALNDIPFDEGTMEVKISDELGKIQVNALVNFPEGQSFNQSQMIMWERFLGYIRPEEGLENDDTMPSAIINSVKDWLDSGDDDAITGVNGAESDYYEGLDPPYACKNKPLSSVEELVMVKGVADLAAGIGGMEQIAGFITVHGMEANTDKKFTFPGKININTAELPVLAALLPSGEAHLASEFIDYREEMSEGQYTHDLSNPQWYKNAPGLGDIAIDSNLITTTSDFFRIDAKAVLNDITLATTALVKREKDKKTGKYVCKVLYWKNG
jgi:general secretion pathway protein K